MPDPIQVSNQSNTSQIQLNSSGLDNELKILVGENSIYIIEPNETSSQQITPNSLYINEPTREPSQEIIPNSLYILDIINQIILLTHFRC